MNANEVPDGFPEIIEVKKSSISSISVYLSTMYLSYGLYIF